MARIKSIVICLLLVGVISCYDRPEFPITPSISFNRVEFQESKQVGVPDVLTLFIDFKDGDGDLGLRAEEIDPPYHSANYFYDDNGKALTIRSRDNPKYAYLPPYEDPYTCTNYTDPEQVTYLPATVVDDTFNIVETTD